MRNKIIYKNSNKLEENSRIIISLQQCEKGILLNDGIRLNSNLKVKSYVIKFVKLFSKKVNL